MDGYPTRGKAPTVMEELKAVKDRLEDIEKIARGAKLLWPLGNHDARFETDVMKYLRSLGHFAERLAKAGANDDVVLTPTSVKVLMEDVAIVRTMNSYKAGWVAARCDAARPCQNVRITDQPEKLHFYKFPSESHIKMAQEVSPIFAWISSDAFEEAKFPPLNWYSDDVHCMDLIQKGYAHYVSASYVHHIGSNTIGFNAQKLHEDALPWLRENRPEYASAWFDS